MQKPLFGQKTAILVANGFSESDLIETQRRLQNLGADTRIVSMDQGLVNSWNGSEWGLNFAVDQTLNASLAVDYSILLIPGGQRSIDKLQLTAHTRRFIRGFVDSGKPVLLLGEAEALLAFSEIEGGQDHIACCDLDIENDQGALDKIQAFLVGQLCASKEAIAA